MNRELSPSGYEDIENLEYEGVKKHRKMSMESRAAQFAPFAALNGHDEAIEETARQYSRRQNEEEN